MTGWQWVKVVGNFLNLSTVAGLVVGAIGRAPFSRGPRGLFYANGYRLGFPYAGAFTIGNVVLSKHERSYFDEQPLVMHEERHSWQYLCLIGLPLLPLYGVAAVVSWALTGDPASRNPFERLAKPFSKTLTQTLSVLRSRPKAP